MKTTLTQKIMDWEDEIVEKTLELMGVPQKELSDDLVILMEDFIRKVWVEKQEIENRKGAPEMKRHINNLKKLFPKASKIEDGVEFNDGREEGISIWTSFAEEGIIDYWTGYVDPKLQSYLDDNDLWFEYYDSGTVFIFKD